MLSETVIGQNQKIVLSFSPNKSWFWTDIVRLMEIETKITLLCKIVLLMSGVLDLFGEKSLIMVQKEKIRSVQVQF